MKPNNPDIDSALVKSLSQGNNKAFESLFKRYAQKLFSFSLSYLKNENEAEEVVQEVFLKVWLNRATLKTNTSFQSYLFTIAFNSVKKTFNQKAKNNQFKLEIIDMLDSETEGGDFEKNYQLIIQKLELFIDEMPDRRKAIFIRRKKQGESLVQISEEMSISVKTVENQITEAMKYLKKRFGEELPAGLLFLSLFLEK